MYNDGMNHSVHTGRLTADDFNDRIIWCEATFGKKDVFVGCVAVFRFKRKKDATLFALRWS